MWVEESIHSKNTRLADIEAQGVSNFPEWKERVWAAVGQVKAAEISVKTLKQEVIQLNNSSTKHDDELGMIFNSFDTYQSPLQKSIQTATERIDNIEASKLGGIETVTVIPEQLILERKVEELEMDCINDRLRIYGLESRINAGANELQVGEFIICSPKYLMAYLVATDSEEVNFGVFVYPYNILTRIQQRLKGEDTLTEVVKHKKYLASLNMYEDEAITVYTLSIFAPGLFGGKCSTKSDIGRFLDYAKWRNKSLQKGLGYNIEKMLDPVYRDIKMIIAMKYQPYPPLRVLDTKMESKAIKFISVIVR